MAKRNRQSSITYTHSYSSTPMSPEAWERCQRLLAKMVAQAYMKYQLSAVTWCPDCPHPEPECDESNWRQNVLITKEALEAKMHRKSREM